MAMGSCWHGGELRARFVGGDAKSQALSLNEMLFGCGGKNPPVKGCAMLGWQHHAMLRAQRSWGCREPLVCSSSRCLRLPKTPAGLQYPAGDAAASPRLLGESIFLCAKQKQQSHHHSQYPTAAGWEVGKSSGRFAPGSAAEQRHQQHKVHSEGEGPRELIYWREVCALTHLSIGMSVSHLSMAEFCGHSWWWRN